MEWEHDFDYHITMDHLPIDEIKFQELDQENELKEKRELDSTKAAVLRAIQDSLAQAETAKQKCIELVQKTDNLRSQLEVRKLHKIAITQQVDVLKKELDELKVKSDQGISEVWELRSSLSKAIHNVSDKCDIWALLMKPNYIEPIIKPQLPETTKSEQVLVVEKRLHDAIARRDLAQIERDRLMGEPETGLYKRIKNALQYSLKMISSHKTIQQN